MREEPTVMEGAVFYPPLLCGRRWGVHILGPLIRITFDDDTFRLAPRGWRALLPRPVRIPLARIRAAKTILGRGVRLLSDDPALDGLALRPYGVSTATLIGLLAQRGITVARSSFGDKLKDAGRELLAANGLRERGPW